MNWLARMMYGRYGTDQLGFFTLLLMLIWNMVFAFTGWDALYILSFALAILSIFRIFSKNVSKRYEENQKFLQMTAPVRSFFSAKTAGLLDLRTHRHFRCPQCKQKIRVPRGKGNIQITCPKCRHEFVKKS